MNANGEVLGLIQKNASDEAKESYAIGATYGASLSITALSLNDMSLNKIGIKKGLPETEDQALVYLFMASSQQNQDEYITTLNDFLEQYPNSRTDIYAVPLLIWALMMMNTTLWQMPT